MLPSLLVAMPSLILRNESGKGPEDVLSDAKILFCEQQGMEFAFVE
ncbi:TPA: hypothetical protein N0F65_009502 [Lagenidium giganteum]|uniref:Uncharacterized protein n=1 Tax=Lagenidium giganteum TaxID=4803 RepID=A0AAV2ZBY6_9STRA|nr:TPA: hypothetical protein N0F65_009502 [Lagenidium giganteum]